MGRTFSSNLILLILLVLSACGGSGEVPVAQQQNNQPRAVSDSYKVDSNTSLPVLSNDSDPDGDSISITAITQPPHGTASINGDVIDLQIDQDFVGVETFTYTISDSKGATATAQVTLELNPANKVPVANNDRVVGQRDAIIDIAVLENDSDENGDALTITEVGSASSGSVSIVNNAIRYIPNAGFIGDDTFTYTVSDGSLIASASVTIVVNDASAAGNQTPITQADNFSVLFETTTNLDVLLNDSDPENDQLSIIEILEPDHGSVAIVTISSNGTNIDGIEYTPHPNYIGVDSLIYIVSDGNTSTAETVHLEVKTQEQNNRPSAKDDSVFTTPGNSVALSPYTNDLDLDGDALSLVTISAPLNGTVSIDDNGTPNNFLDDVITYTPDPGFIGTETLVYSLSDGFDEDRAAINFIVASSQANTMQVTGSVHKGAVASSLVSLYESDRNGMPIWSKPVISATSEPDGSWVTAVPTNKTLLIAVAEGGSFIDETEPDSNATSKRLVTLSQLPVLESVWESGQTHVSINAYTSALLRKARFESSSSIFVTLDNNRGFAKDAFGYDPFSTRPTDPIEPDPAASTDAMNYAVFLGGFANALNANATEFNLALPTSELVDAVIEDLSDCVLDAKSFAVPVPFSSSFLNDITDINPEIRRFRNNNFTRFPGPQVEINITACQQDGTSTDFEAPVISLNPATSGDIDFSVLAGDTFVDPGASATDNVDGDLSTSVTTEIRLDANLVSTVDTTIPGDYIITYSVIDTSGNTTTDSRVVTVLLPDLSINDVQITEGDVGTTDMIFTVSLDQAIGLDIMVDASTDDTASTAKLSDNDYVANAQSLTIPAGQTTAIFTVQVNNDIKVEQNETIVVRLSNAVNAALLDAQGQGTIINDDATTLSVSDATVTEGNSGNTDLIFQISLSAPSFQPITVEFRTEDITAQVSDSDYIPLGGSINTVTFPPNITMIPVTIPVKGDFKPEADETLRLLILNAVNASISDPEGIGTILNDDLLSLSISDAMVTEGNSGDTPQLEFVITLDQSSEADVSFDVRTIDGSALQSDSDYVADAGSTLIIPANQLNISYFVDITGDELVEADETLNVEISNPVNATISNSMANGTILNDDGVSIRVNDVAITEGDSANPQAIFTVSLSNPDTINIVEVDYQTSAVTAVAGNDFTPVSGRLSFPLNQTTQTIAVDILNDTLVESIETFTLDLSNELNATMADAQGVATITDNDKSVVSVNSASLAEGDVGVSGMNFTFTLDQVSVDDIVIDYNTQDNTATGADADFVATAGSAVITAGTLNTTVVIDVNGDVQVEADESFLLNLVNATNASIATLSTSGNIFNDDASLIMQKIVINDNTGAATVANFNVTTDAGVANFSSANTVGASTTYTSELIPVNAGTYSLTELEIPGYSEGLWSCDAGNLTANAFNAGSISLLNGDEAVCSITNNDEAIISIDSPSIVEGNTGTVDLVYTVSLDQASTVDVTVDADVSGGTATPGIDFTATQQTLSIPAGSTSTTYT
ncbi:MAG: tandem-95 repeat protein, partial [Gammaproteobacteria bacterium]|nr:tandem-95 repeat protein [Gammaproteobacteria bacterium]